MIREVVKIDENLCNGCAECVPACHEGALQIIDGKARLISDLMCDGLGACLGHCPMDAITIEKREAEPYNEIKVMEIMVSKGKNTVVAHMKHLKDHNETQFLKEAVHFLRQNSEQLSFSADEVIREVHNHGHVASQSHQHAHATHGGGGCPGSQAQTITPKGYVVDSGAMVSGQSELRQWPVQMHLINPAANYFQNSDVVIAADCVAFAMGNFHQKFLKGKTLAIACPKLDDGQETYINKITRLINEANVNTITVLIMQVPCCGGLLQIAKIASSQASRKVPLKLLVVSIEGEVLKEEWV